jgi:hypothetical protein
VAASVGVGVADGVGVEVGLGVPVGVEDGVAVGTAVSVGVGVGVSVGVGVRVGVTVGVGSGVWVGVGVGTAVAVGVGVRVAVGASVGVRVGVGVAVGVGVGLGAAEPNTTIRMYAPGLLMSRTVSVLVDVRFTARSKTNTFWPKSDGRATSTPFTSIRALLMRCVPSVPPFWTCSRNGATTAAGRVMVSV